MQNATRPDRLTEYQQQLVVENIPLAEYRARYHHQPGSPFRFMGLMELRSAALHGLILGAKCYDANNPRVAKFSTYAVTAIDDRIRLTSRHFYATTIPAQVVKGDRARFSRRKGPLRLTEEAQNVAVRRAINSVMLGSVQHNEEGDFDLGTWLSLHGTGRCRHDSPVGEIESRDRFEFLLSAVRKVIPTSRAADVWIDRVLHGLQFKELARKYGITSERVRQVYQMADRHVQRLTVKLAGMNW